ncbi:uncharacterized protein LOC144550837 [Carex rostrata]
MAIVCQECGDLGYEDLLVYCSLCHQAAQHKYCMDTLLNNNEDIKWSCEDCNRMSIKLSHGTNGQDLKIPNNDIGLSAKSNAYLYQDKCKLFISNDNKMIISKDSSANDLHGARVSDGGKNRLNLHSLKSHVTKAWGKNNKRTIKSIKPTLETYIDPLRNRGTTSQPFQRSKNSGRQRRLILLDEDDDSKDEIEKDYPLDQSFENGMPNYHRRKLLLSDEEDEQNNNLEAALLPKRIFCSKNNEMKEVGSTLKKTDDEMTMPNYHRRKLVLSDEEDEQNNNLGVTLMSERIVCSKNNEMKEVRSTLKKTDDEMPMPNYHRRKLVLSDEEDGQNNNLVAALLPERIVCSKNNETKEFGLTLKKMDDEMTIETDSGGDSMKMLSANSTSSNVQLRNVQEFEVLQSEFYFISAMPIRSYSWRGWFDISGRVYGPLTAHLSTKAGEKALNATKFLSPIIQLTRVSMSHAWPKSFGNSPSADHIALFFFPLVDSGVEEMVDQLLEEVINHAVVLKVLLEEAEMLVFPSVLLPKDHKTYQDKYYLWSVFRRKDSDTNSGEILELGKQKELLQKK